MDESSRSNTPSTPFTPATSSQNNSNRRLDPNNSTGYAGNQPARSSNDRSGAPSREPSPSAHDSLLHVPTADSSLYNARRQGSWSEIADSQSDAPTFTGSGWVPSRSKNMDEDFISEVSAAITEASASKVSALINRNSHHLANFYGSDRQYHMAKWINQTLTDLECEMGALIARFNVLEVLAVLVAKCL